MSGRLGAERELRPDDGVSVRPTPAYVDALGRARDDRTWQVVDQVGTVHASGLPTRKDAMELVKRRLEQGPRFPTYELDFEPRDRNTVADSRPRVILGRDAARRRRR